MKAKPSATSLAAISLPADIDGFTVVACIRLPDAPGYMSARHLVTCASWYHSGTFNTWLVYPAPDPVQNCGAWVRMQGHYDQTLEAALRDMVTRALPYL